MYAFFVGELSLMPFLVLLLLGEIEVLWCWRGFFLVGLLFGESSLAG